MESTRIVVQKSLEGTSLSIDRSMDFCMQDVPLIQSVNTPYQHTLTKHLFNIPYQHTVVTQLINAAYQYTHNQHILS